MARAFFAVIAIGFALSQPAAEYERISPHDTARLTITPEGGGRYHVTGFALWGEHRRETHPVHTGELDFTAELVGDTFAHSEPVFPGRTHSVVLRFDGDMLHVTEEGFIGVHGFNVTFEGTYRQSGE